MNLFCSICRGEIFDTSLSPLNSLHFVRYEGKCERNGTLLPFYFFEIDDGAFDHLLSVNDVNHYGAERLRDAWMTMIQSLIHDFSLVNEADDQFVFEVKIQYWMGPRYVVGLLRTEDTTCARSPRLETVRPFIELCFLWRLCGLLSGCRTLRHPSS